MRDAFIIVVEHSDKLSDVLDALPFDDAEFRELASKEVRNGRPLVDELLPGCMIARRRCDRYAATQESGGEARAAAQDAAHESESAKCVLVDCKAAQADAKEDASRAERRAGPPLRRSSPARFTGRCPRPRGYARSSTANTPC